MALYRTRQGDSPAIIARRHGTTVAALLAANPNKPTTVVAGRTTWRGLQRNEPLSMPVGIGALGDGDVGLGDASSDINALMNAGGPCQQANVGLVCAVQRALGVTVDGKYGSGTSTAARRFVSNAPAGCSPRPGWWAPVGQSNCPSGGGGSATPAAGPSGTSLDRAAGAAYSALGADPNYCASVKRVGSAVNTAVHNFKAAWNAANPSRSVPIGTGNYEASVAAALSSALGGIAVPPGCGATVAQAAVQANQVNQQAQAQTVAAQVDRALPQGSSSSAPAAVQALIGINPCLQANSGVVYTAQTALGIVADGKYGPGTSAAARKLVPNAPAACSPAPMWWGAKGTAQAKVATDNAKTAASGLPATNTVTPDIQAHTTGAAAIAQAKDAANTTTNAKTQAELDKAATDAAAAKDLADKAAALATTQDQLNQALAAKALADKALVEAQAKGGTALTPPEAKKGLSTGAIVAGAVGAAALVGLIALAVSGKKTGHRGRRGPAGRSRRKASKRKPARRKTHRKSAKRRR